MLSFYNKKILVLLFFIFILFPRNAQALSCSNPGDQRYFSGCITPFACPYGGVGSTNTEFCRSSDGTIISQPDYYASSDCSGNPGFCGSQCNPNVDNTSGYCHCYSGSVTSTQACQGNWGSSSPFWCHSISCGTKCSGAPDYRAVEKNATSADYGPATDYNSTTCHANNCIPTSSTNYQCVSGGCPPGWNIVDPGSGTSCGFGSGDTCCSQTSVPCTFSYINVNGGGSYAEVPSGGTISINWGVTGADNTKSCSWVGESPAGNPSPQSGSVQFSITNTTPYPIDKNYQLSCFNPSNQSCTSGQVSVRILPSPTLSK